MVNHQLDLESKEPLNNVLLKNTSFFEQTKDFAFKIWEFVYALHKELSPSSISIYQQCDGIVFVKCNNSLFCNLRYSSCDKELLHAVSVIAEDSNIQGKMYLYSPKGLLNKLDFTF